MKKLPYAVFGGLILLVTSFNPPSDPPLKASADVYNISGTVTGNIYNNPIPNAKILFFTPDNLQTPLDSAFTDETGYYNKDLVFTTHVTEQIQTLDDKIYPNPYVNSTNINVNAKKNGMYDLNIINTQGQIITTQNLYLEEGNNQINLTGGNKGLHIITLNNENETHTYKAIQTTNTGTQHKAEVTANTPYKATNNTPDSLRLKILALDYYTADTNIQLIPIAVADVELLQEPYEFNTTIKPYLETGISPLTINPNFTITIDWPQQGIMPSTSQTYPLIGEEIQITKYMYPHNNTLGTALISNDTTDLDGDGYWVQSWSLGRQPKQVTNRPNIYQNEEFALIPEHKTLVPLDSLEGATIHHYVIKNKAATSSGTEDLNSLFSRALIASSGQALSSMFIDLAPFGVADSLDIVKFNFNMTTLLPMPEYELNRASAMLDSILQTRYLPNGDTILPPHRVYSIDNFNDPRWQEVEQRNGDNSIYVTFHNGLPSNGRSWLLNYTYNGHLRIKNTHAKFNTNNSNGIILAEIISAVAGVEEGTGGLAGYVNSVDGVPSEYCKSISTIPALLNLGTGQSWKNEKNTPPKLKEYETLEVTTTHNPDGTNTQETRTFSNYNFFREVQKNLNYEVEHPCPTSPNSPAPNVRKKNDVAIQL